MPGIRTETNMSSLTFGRVCGGGGGGGGGRVSSPESHFLKFSIHDSRTKNAYFKMNGYTHTRAVGLPFSAYFCHPSEEKKI